MDDKKLGSVLVLTDATFTEVVTQSKGLILVDFWAPWCGPCKALGPKIEELAAQTSDQFAKINTDDNQKQASGLGVRGIPCMVLFKDGKEVDRLMGNQPKENITKMLDKYR